MTQSAKLQETRVALFSIVMVLIVIGTIGGYANTMAPLLQHLRANPQDANVMPADPSSSHEVTNRFNQGVALLHAKRYEYAMTAFDRVLQLAPRMPEANVNMGFAMLGLKEYDQAAHYFQTATELNPSQANAYWGLAIAAEAQKDLEMALGAMRTYIHLSTPDDPYLAKARSALWEWEAQLGRGDGIPDAERSMPVRPPAEHGRKAQ